MLAIRMGLVIRALGVGLWLALLPGVTFADPCGDRTPGDLQDPRKIVDDEDPDCWFWGRLAAATKPVVAATVAAVIAISAATGRRTSAPSQPASGRAPLGPPSNPFDTGPAALLGTPAGPPPNPFYPEPLPEPPGTEPVTPQPMWFRPGADIRVTPKELADYVERRSREGASDQTIAAEIERLNRGRGGSGSVSYPMVDGGE